MSRLPKSYCALGIAAILVCSQFPRAQEVARVSTLNLQDYGWESPDPRRAPEIDRPAIAVDHNNRVVIGFTVRERGGLVTRNQPSLDFRIVRFSSDGKQDLSLSLPTHARGINGIYLTDTDKIVARVNDELRILEHEEDTLRKESWNILVSCPRDCQIRQSSTRHTVSLYNVDAVPPLTIIQAAEPPIIRQCGKAPRQIESPDDTVQNYPQAITDKFAYFSGSFSMHEPFAYRWPLCDYDHRIEMEPPLKGGVSH